MHLSSYTKLLKFSTNVELVCTDSNFENCQIVIDFILENNRLFLELKKEEMVKKLFIVHKADRSFVDNDFYSFKYDVRSKKQI